MSFFLQKALTEALDIDPSARHVFVGDFNIDRKKDEGKTFIAFMETLGLHPVLPPECPTTDHGTQIDQVFTNIPRVSAGVGESPKSFHKPIWIVI